MAKRIALKDFVEVDHVNLSDHCRAISSASDQEQVDVSGFNTTGNDEFLAGKTTQAVNATFFMDGAAGSTFQVLWPLHRDRSVFTLKWRKDQTAAVSATNPELRGNAQLLSFPQGAERGSVETADVVFTAGDSAGFTWIYT